MNSKTFKVREQINKSVVLFPMNSIWKHYKGDIYKVVDHAYDTEEDEATVIYTRIDGPEFDELGEQFIKYARPLSVMMTENRFSRVHKTTVTVWAEGADPFYE